MSPLRANPTIVLEISHRNEEVMTKIDVSSEDKGESTKETMENEVDDTTSQTL